MAETYGLAYRLYVFLWFQLTAILETIGNSFNAVGLYRRRRAKLPDSLAGQTVLITGANSGIGKETAKAAAARGAVVLLACRDLKKAEQAVAEILEDVGKDKNLHLFELDLSSLASVRACAAAISERFSVIDVLINNAGLMMCPQ
ncbi:PREDICTED: retinol dehydrogenase 12-like, partial [Rhagoletis zephyria]|uniref:retinol dehydrogenase 12-like n=1 Tax=Rhagoletis zephyria TaxID=28612 RepID=UPI000811624D